MSVTWMVTLMESFPPLPSLTSRTTLYSDLVSKSSSAFVRIWPDVLSIEKLSTSTPAMA